MGDNRRFYWLKLHKDFFDSVRIKKLRAIAGGDTFTIIYLKLLLYSMNTDGLIEFQGVEESPEDELALILNEEPDNVKLCLNYLKIVHLAEERDMDNIFLPEAITYTGSECSSAKRVREFRERKKLTADANQSTKALPSNTDVTQVKRNSNVEIERDKEKEIEKIRVDTELVNDTDLWFGEFWKLYPRKVAKANAVKAFKKKCKDEQTYTAIMRGLQNYVTACKGKDPQYIAHPATWINGERWNDEVATKTKSSNPFLDMLNDME